MIGAIAELIRYCLTRIDTVSDSIIRILRAVALTVRKFPFAHALAAVSTSTLRDFLRQSERRRIAFHRLGNDRSIEEIYEGSQRYEEQDDFEHEYRPPWRPGRSTDAGSLSISVASGFHCGASLALIAD